MTRLRETLNPEESLSAQAGATRVKTPGNPHPLRCGSCGGIFHVDDSIYHQFRRAIDYDASDNPFLCEQCNEEEAEEEHSHA
jgi:hypothetical protein